MQRKPKVYVGLSGYKIIIVIYRYGRERAATMKEVQPIPLYTIPRYVNFHNNIQTKCHIHIISSPGDNDEARKIVTNDLYEEGYRYIFFQVKISILIFLY